MNLFANLLLNILFQSGWATAQKAFIKAELGEIVNTFCAELVNVWLPLDFSICIFFYRIVSGSSRSAV
jgi:hypothetical protein